MKVTSLLDLIEKHGQARVDSLFKYPSIKTYNELGDRGMLKEGVYTDGEQFNENEELFFTEKVDGTNGRIVFDHSDLWIGSRDEFIYADDDRCINNKLGIVSTIKKHTDQKLKKPIGIITAIYGEVYGGSVGSNSKCYTTDRSVSGYRVFDVIQLTVIEADDILSDMSGDQLAGWRERGGQPFLKVNELKEFCKDSNLEMVPYIEAVLPTDTSLYGISKWLTTTLPNTLVPLTNEALGHVEGIVVRNQDRTMIRKIRKEDYVSTIARSEKKKSRKG